MGDTAATARWRAKNPEKVREYWRLDRERRREQRREAARRAEASRRRFLNGVKLGSGCVDCDYWADARALEFDHIEPGTSMVRCRTWAAIIRELEKVEVRCANCHAIITAVRRGS